MDGALLPDMSRLANFALNYLISEVRRSIVSDPSRVRPDLEHALACQSMREAAIDPALPFRNSLWNAQLVC